MLLRGEDKNLIFPELVLTFEKSLNHCLKVFIDKGKICVRKRQIGTMKEIGTGRWIYSES